MYQNHSWIYSKEFVFRLYFHLQTLNMKGWSSADYQKLKIHPWDFRGFLRWFTFFVRNQHNKQPNDHEIYKDVHLKMMKMYFMNASSTTVSNTNVWNTWCGNPSICIPEDSSNFRIYTKSLELYNFQEVPNKFPHNIFWQGVYSLSRFT